MNITARGTPASVGIYTGQVRVIKNIRELTQLQDGEILIVRASSPAWTVGMLRSGAIIAELGGPICHAAIVAREMGIPAVVSVSNAMSIFTTGMTVTVNGAEGTVKISDDAQETSAAEFRAHDSQLPGEIDG